MIGDNHSDGKALKKNHQRNSITRDLAESISHKSSSKEICVIIEEVPKSTLKDKQSTNQQQTTSSFSALAPSYLRSIK